MRSDKQSEASRRNGSKSTGPVTDQGKAKSAQNAATHNLSGDHFALLSNEDPKQFAIHESDFLQRFQPVDGVEHALVQKMIVASWREFRIDAMESALFDIEIARQQAAVDEEFSEISPAGRQVLALFGTTDAAAASGLLLRYASSARRAFQAAFRTLRELQGDRFNRKSNIVTRYAPSRVDAAPTPAQAQAPEAQTSDGPDNQAQASAHKAPAIVLHIRKANNPPPTHAAELYELQNEPKQPEFSPATVERPPALRAFAAA